ncbi:MAG: serine/threonine-protein kinase [Planctomycetota bacterium]|jgi:tetratricopeptide (TPR) repeat protein
MRDDERIADILGQWRQRREAGEASASEQLLREYPEYAEQLAEHIAAERLLDEELPGVAEGTPSRIGDFSILRELGRGGMGVVYEAEQISMRRKVALKVLPVAITGTPQAVKRFQREAHAAGKLHHTNIVPIHAMGQHAGHWYYAMELVEGRPLSDVIVQLRRAAKPTEEELARVAQGGEPASSSRIEELDTDTGDRSYFTRVAGTFAAVADGLQLAHVEGIVHRDIKPSNLLLDVDGTLKVVDFGLAYVDDAGGPAMTVTGDLLGTPVYMSPEQAMAKRMPVDHRTDVYSLGATLYELLTLQPPFGGGTLHEICTQIITKDPTPPRRRNPNVSRDLETIVLKAMEKDRDKRYQSAAEFARDLRRFVEGAAIRARRVGPAERTWRRIRRHRMRATLLAASVLLAAAAAVATIRSVRESALRQELEYERLCMVAEALAQETEEGAVSLETSAELLGRAIEMIPDRGEAYWLRALVPGRSTEERLADLEVASGMAGGISTHTFRLAGAYFRISAEPSLAAEEMPVLPSTEHGTPADAYFESSLLDLQGRRGPARDLATRAVDASRAGTLIHNLALRRRARILRLEGDFPAALADLHRLRELGDTPSLQVATASMWRRMGKEALSEKRFTAALEGVRKASTPTAWRALCRACMSLRESAWLDRASEAAMASDPGSLEHLYWRALSLQRRRPERAVELFRKLLGAGGTPAIEEHLHYGLSVALFNMHDLDGALAECDLALQANPRCMHARAQRVCVLNLSDRADEGLEECQTALEIAPFFAGLYCQKAACLNSIGRFKEAYAAANRAPELDPGHGVCANGNRGDALKGLGKFDDAYAAYTKGLAVAPDSPRLLSQRALLLVEQERYEDALEDLTALTRVAPSDHRAHIYQAKALIFLERHQEALAAANLAAELGAPVWRAQWYRGTALFALESYNEALDSFDRSIAANPPAEEAWLLFYERARALVALDLHEDALEACKKALDRHDGDWRLHRMHSSILRKLKRRLESDEAALQAVELGCEESRVLIGAARYCLSPGVRDARKASVLARRATDKEPGSADYWNLLGAALATRGDLPGAVAAFREAVRLRPDLAERQLNLAKALTELGIARAEQGVDGAEQAFREAIDLQPDFPKAHRGLAILLLRGGDRVGAAEAGEHAIDLGWGDDPRLLNMVAWVRATCSEPDARDAVKALEFAKRANDLAPEVAACKRTLGVAQYRNGDHEAATATLEAALELREGWGREHAVDAVFLAMARHRLGRATEANALYDRAVAWMEEHKPDDEELKRFRAEAEGVLGIKRD